MELINRSIKPWYGSVFCITVPLREHHWPVDSPHKGPVMRSFVVSFAVSLEKPLNKQWSYHWFEITWYSCEVTVMPHSLIIRQVQCTWVFHYVNFAMRWGTASKRASSRRATPKRDSSLIGHWMGHLLSYSLSGGHDGPMLPINPRGLNGPLTSHFIFSSHMYFSLNTPTHYWSPMPN